MVALKTSSSHLEDHLDDVQLRARLDVVVDLPDDRLRPRHVDLVQPRLLDALSLCTTVQPLYTKFANKIGASFPETTMRSNPSRAFESCSARSATSTDGEELERASFRDCPPGAGNRIFWRLSALRAYTKHHTTSIYCGKCYGRLTASGGPGPRARAESPGGAEKPVEPGPPAPSLRRRRRRQAGALRSVDCLQAGALRTLGCLRRRQGRPASQRTVPCGRCCLPRARRPLLRSAWPRPSRRPPARPNAARSSPCPALICVRRRHT